MHWFTGSLRVLLMMLSSSTAVTASTAKVLQGQLDALADTLRWNGGTHASYAPIGRAARCAHSTLTLIATHHPQAIPQALEFIETLGRLVAESRYLVELSTPKDYRQAFLDSTVFLTCSVDEWRFTITTMRTRLEESSNYTLPQPNNGRNVGFSRNVLPGTLFRDSHNAPTMIVIPTGCFTAGSNHEEQELWQVPENTRDFELPRRNVCISKPLAFSTTEITVKEFDTFVRSTGYKPRGGARWFNPAVSNDMVFNPNLTYHNPGFPQTVDSPVVAITRQDANEFAHWISAATGANYRLPTEDEWEWAARGGSNDTFFWGNDLESANLYANTYDQTAKQASNFSWPPVPVTDGFPYTAPVASFAPNGFGLYDVTGNAREFVSDNWVLDLSTAANDGSIRTGSAPFPVVRGGAWNYRQRNYRINYRDGYFSSEVATHMFGFRLVRDL